MGGKWSYSGCFQDLFKIACSISLCSSHLTFFQTFCQKDPIRCYHSKPEWTTEQWPWRGNLHSPKLQHYWNLIIRLFSHISGHSLGEGLTPLQMMQLVYSTVPTDWAVLTNGIFINKKFVIKNETYKIFWNFKIQTDNLSSKKILFSY